MAPVTLARGTTAELSHGTHQGSPLRSPKVSVPDPASPDGDQFYLNDTPGQDSQRCVTPSLRKGWWQTVLAPSISSMSVLEQDALAYPPPNNANYRGACALGMTGAQLGEEEEEETVNDISSPRPVILPLKPPELSEPLTPILDRIRAHEGDGAASMVANSMQGKLPRGRMVEGCYLCQTKYTTAVITAFWRQFGSYEPSAGGEAAMSGEPHEAAAGSELPSLQYSTDLERIRQPSLDGTGPYPPLRAAQAPQQRHREVDSQPMEARMNSPNTETNDGGSIKKVTVEVESGHHEEELQNGPPPVLPSIELGHETDNCLFISEDMSHAGTTSRDPISRKRKHSGVEPVLYDPLSQVPPEHDNDRLHMESPALDGRDQAAVTDESDSLPPPPMYSLPSHHFESAVPTDPMSTGNPASFRVCLWPSLDSDSAVSADPVSSGTLSPFTVLDWSSDPDSEPDNLPPSLVDSLPSYHPDSAVPPDPTSTGNPSSSRRCLEPSSDSHSTLSGEYHWPSDSDSQWAAPHDEEQIEAGHEPGNPSSPRGRLWPSSDSGSTVSTDSMPPRSPSRPPASRLPEDSASVVPTEYISSPRTQFPDQRPTPESHHPTASGRSPSSLDPPATGTPAAESKVNTPYETEPLRRSKRQRIARVPFSPSGPSVNPPRSEPEGPPAKRRRTGRRGRPAELVEELEPPILDEIHVKGEDVRTKRSTYKRGMVAHRSRPVGSPATISNLGEGDMGGEDILGSKPPKVNGYLADIPGSAGNVKRSWRLRGSLRATGL